VGVMLLARGLTRRALVAAFFGGVLLAFALYLSYGLTLLAPIVLAVVFLARRWRPLVLAALGGGVVIAAFTASGFWWWDGYQLVVERYYQGVASQRSYGYWVWANLAAVVASAGLAAAPVLRRAALARPVTAERLLPIAALMAILVADVSGLSKAEVERIWLPFAVWLMAGAALLPPASRRGWLLAQAVIALLINHLLLTTW
jgi:methylthioxylose transferase